jgi:hypothetical protein
MATRRVWQVGAGADGHRYDESFLEHDVMFEGGRFYLYDAKKQLVGYFDVEKPRAKSLRPCRASGSDAMAELIPQRIAEARLP